ncbi:30S ribosomal protein S9 [Candidatus Nardonella dryophthoridicola]|uniref:30S ribosomal protein S9 n=1 Tax=Candidatus Nardonella dryophthoridicola TaxID=1971485 RepID=UPI001AD862BB|nr:30S ribosomal protein S9 [Candidatus Nardonella dryophthoridicola]QTJ62807.1 30S ribosomal protein S9 [Candidatus Nardonella dryophthoridicola]
MNKIYHNTAKRKTSIARVFIKKGVGNIKINRININDYFYNKLYINIILKPIIILNMINKIDIFITVKGGGIMSQLNAIKLAISKTLVDINLKFKTQLKKEKLLTSDSRIVERKKYGFKKSRKKIQFSKR